MESTRCIICNSDDYEIILTSKDQRSPLGDKKFSLVRCKKCQLVYLNPRPTKDEINNFYPEDYYATRINFVEKVIDNLLNKVLGYNLNRFKKNGRLLDLGCGAGSFLLEMKKRGFETIGIDISKKACEVTRGKGLKALQGDLKDQKFPDNYFDIVTLWHVFEHLHHPPFTIREIARIIKKDGILVIETPNIESFSFNFFKQNFFHLDLPRHLYHWSLKTLKEILVRNGFTVIKSDSFSLAFPFSLFHSLNNLLSEHDIKKPFSYAFLLISSPILIPLTFFFRFIPASSNIIRVYARKSERRFRKDHG